MQRALIALTCESGCQAGELTCRKSAAFLFLGHEHGTIMLDTASFMSKLVIYTFVQQCIYIYGGPAYAQA